MVAVNGAEIVHCDSLVKEDIRSYWSKSKRVENRLGHFVRRSSNITDYLHSETVDNMMKVPPKLPVMK